MSIIMIHLSVRWFTVIKLTGLVLAEVEVDRVYQYFCNALNFYQKTSSNIVRIS